MRGALDLTQSRRNQGPAPLSPVPGDDRGAKDATAPLTTARPGLLARREPARQLLIGRGGLGPPASLRHPPLIDIAELSGADERCERPQLVRAVDEFEAGLNRPCHCERRCPAAC
jgi:hypothetical protein